MDIVTRQKISEATKKAMANPELRKHLSEIKKGKKLSETHKKKLPKVGGWNKGKSMSEEWKKNLSISHLGRNAWNKGKKLPPMTTEQRIKISNAHKVRVIKGVCHLWKGGLTEKSLLVRKSIEYRLWREAVFKRDSFTCQECSDNRGGNLEAHHIKPFALFPELRLAIDNGVTLCKECHKKTDTWGWRTRDLLVNLKVNVNDYE